MAIYKSIQKTAPFAAISGTGLDGRTIHTSRGEYNVPVGTTLTTADQIDMFDLPRGARIVGQVIYCDKIDTGTTLRLNLGTSDNTSLLLAGANIGTTVGGTILGTASMNPVGFDYTVTAKKQTFSIRPSANATGVQAGKIITEVHYTQDQPA